MDSAETRAQVNDFVNRSFRDMADKDYIAARIAYRIGLDQQFLWSALQAIEKYLKAILIYNGLGATGLSHKLDKALKRVQEIEDISFDFPKDVCEFIQYLNTHGQSRYFEFPYYTNGTELFSLDKTVWYIRKYCFYLRGKTKTLSGEEGDSLYYNLEKIHLKDYEEYPTKYKIHGGYLEDLLKKRKSEQRKYLIWKNAYFGTYQKKIPSRFIRLSAANPTHFMYPEIYSHLTEMVTFSKDLQNFMTKAKKDEK